MNDKEIYENVKEQIKSLEEKNFHCLTNMIQIKNEVNQKIRWYK